MSTAGVGHIFCRVLDLQVVDGSANFFELGGDSLLATRVIAAISRQFGVELELSDLLRFPTPRELADLIARRTK